MPSVPLLPARRPSSLLPFLSLLAVAALAPLAALAQPVDAPSAAFVSRATYAGKVAGDSAEVTVAFQVHVLSDAWAEVPLPPGEYTVRSWKTDHEGAARLLSSGSSSRLLFQKKGRHQVELVLALRVLEHRGLRSLELPLVPAAAAQLDLDVDDADLAFASNPESPLEVSGPASNHVRVVPPPCDSLTLQWYPRARRAEFGPGFRVVDETLYTVTKGVVEGRSALRVLVGRGGVERIALRLPKKGFVLSVEGDTVEQWFVEEQPDARLLHVSFSPRITKEASLVLRHDLPIAAIPGPAALGPLRAEEATEQAGVLAVASESDLALREEELAGLEKVDLASLRETFRQGAARVRYGYRYARPDARLTLAVEKKVPRIRTASESTVLLERDTLLLRTLARVTIDEVGAADLRFRVPADLSILTVAGTSVRDWHVNENTLFVSLVRRQLGVVPLQVEAQEVTSGKPVVAIPRLETLDAVDDTGYVGVLSRGEISLETARLAGAVQVDPGELPEWLRKLGSRLAYKYADRKGGVEVSVVPLAPEVRATVFSRYSVEEGRIAGTHLAAIDVSRAQVFGVDFLLPAGQAPLDVRGEGIRDWTFREADRSLRVEFQAGRMGAAELFVTTERRYAAIPERADLGGPVVAGVKDFRGWAGVAASEEIELTPDKSERVRDASAAELPEGLKRLGATPFAWHCNAADWSVGLSVKALQPKLEAQSVTLLELRRGLLTALAYVDLTVAHAGLARLTVRLPKDAVNSTLDTEGVQNKHLEKGEWDVVFRARRRGTFRLKVSYEKLLSDAEGNTQFRQLDIPGVERHTGHVLVARDRSSAEVDLVRSKEMEQVQRGNLPPEFRDAELAYLHVLHFIGANATADFRVKTHVLGQIAAARIGACELFSVVQADGDTVTYMTAQMTNSTKQFLELGFPKDAVVWGTYVNGRPVKPNVVGEGKVHIPIERSTEGVREFEVELVWADKVKVLGLASNVPFRVPESDVKMESVRWALYLPSGYHVLNSDGSLKLAQVDSGMEAPYLYDRMGTLAQRAWRAIPPWVGQGLLWLVGLALTVLVCLLLVHACKLLLEWLRTREATPLPKWAFAVALLVVGIPLVLTLTTTVGKSVARSFRRSTSALSTGAVRPAEEVDAGTFTGISESAGGWRSEPAAPGAAAAPVGEPSARREGARNNLRQVGNYVTTYVSRFGDQAQQPQSSIGLDSRERSRLIEGENRRRAGDKDAPGRQMARADVAKKQNAQGAASGRYAPKTERAAGAREVESAGEEAQGQLEDRKSAESDRDKSVDDYRNQNRRGAMAENRLRELEKEAKEKYKEDDSSLGDLAEESDPSESADEERAVDRLESALKQKPEAPKPMEKKPAAETPPASTSPVGGKTKDPAGKGSGAPRPPATPARQDPAARPATPPADAPPALAEPTPQPALDGASLASGIAAPVAGGMPGPAGPGGPVAGGGGGAGAGLGAPAAPPVNVPAAVVKPPAIVAAVPKLANVGFLQVQAALKAGEGPLFGRAERGRYQGALPIAVSLPTQDTLKVEFSNPAIAGGRGTVDVWCIAGKGSLALQAVIALVLALGLLLPGLRRPRGAALAAVVSILVSVIASKASETPIDPYVSTAIWTAGAILVLLLARLAASWRRQVAHA